MSNNTSATWQRVGAIAGFSLVVMCTAAGVWFGLNQASLLISPANPTPTTKKVASGQVPHSSATSAGEVVVSKSNYAGPPDIFDAVAAMAATAASASSSTKISATASKLTAAKTVKPTFEDVKPAGWTASATELKQMWESNAASNWEVRSTPLSAPNWSIVGVVQRGTQSQAIVLLAGDPNPQFFKLGDTLPGGAKLTSVEPALIKVTLPDTAQASFAVNVPVLTGALEASTKLTTVTTARP